MASIAYPFCKELLLYQTGDLAQHWLAREFRDALYASCKRGRPKGQGPDGKLLVRVREEGDRWQLEHLLVTLQQRPETSFLDLCAGMAGTLEEAYRRIQRNDSRWCSQWDDVELMLNLNGPLLNGGSDGDNGQTGRKLVMDYYGPRVPIGGGALAGKDPTHVDVARVRLARRLAREALLDGTAECLVCVTFAPGINCPIEVLKEIRCDKRTEGAPSATFGKREETMMAALQELRTGP